jgi:O-acetylhomoserine (thiol)-lyase
MSTQKFATNSLHAGHDVSKHAGTRAVPIYQTTSYVFNNSDHAANLFGLAEAGFIYTRLNNPTNDILEQRLAALEGGIAAVVTASGTSAIATALLVLLKSGDHIVASNSLYGGTYNLLKVTLPRLGITTTFVDPSNPDNFTAAAKENTRVFFAETLGNPKLDVLDLKKISAAAKAFKVPFIVDNTVPSPYLLNPIQFGADLVIHSATKLIDGQGRVLGGVTVGRSDLIREIYLFSRNTGPALSPFNAWVLSKSLETLPVRIEKHSENALKVAEFLENHPNVASVKYPFLKSHPQYEVAKKQMKLGGNIVAFEIKGGIESGRKFLDKIKLCSLSANLGDTRSIVTHPASTTHSKLTEEESLAVSITDGLVRVSVGLETVQDVINDLKQALE